MKPEDLRDLLDDPPILDTAQEADRNALSMADFELDASSEIDLLQMKSAHRVMYWTNAPAGIAGVAWNEAGNAFFFAGKVLTP